MALGKKIAIIGAGNMGEALIAGMLAAKAAAPDDIHATDILPQRLDHLKARYQIRVGMDNKAAAAWSDISVLAVEPQVLDEVLDSLHAELTDAQLILSAAARRGTRTAALPPRRRAATPAAAPAPCRHRLSVPSAACRPRRLRAGRGARRWPGGGAFRARRGGGPGG